MSAYTDMLAGAREQHDSGGCICGGEPGCQVDALISSLEQFDQRDKSRDRPMVDVLESLSARCPSITSYETSALLVAADCVRSVAARLRSAGES